MCLWWEAGWAAFSSQWCSCTRAVGLSNHGHVCTSRLSMVGPIPWCWGRWRWEWPHPYYRPLLPSVPCTQTACRVRPWPMPAVGPRLGIVWESWPQLRCARHWANNEAAQTIAFQFLGTFPGAVSFTKMDVSFGVQALTDSAWLPPDFKRRGINKQTNKNGIQGSSSAACGPS